MFKTFVLTCTLKCEQHTPNIFFLGCGQGPRWKYRLESTPTKATSCRRFTQLHFHASTAAILIGYSVLQTLFGGSLRWKSGADSAEDISSRLSGSGMLSERRIRGEPQCHPGDSWTQKRTTSIMMPCPRGKEGQGHCFWVTGDRHHLYML